MSQGLLAVNNSNQVLVSSDTRNLHFIGKPALYETRKSFDGYGGCRIFVYRVTSPFPILPFFTMPTADYYGIVAIRAVAASLWEIELLRSGTSATLPEVYVFADPRASTATDTHGLVVYMDDGTPAFDSRLKPLTVAGGYSVWPAPDPRSNGIPALSAKYCDSPYGSDAFAPYAYNDFSATQTVTKEIFSYASVAQAQREAFFQAEESECIGGSAYGNCVGYLREELFRSWYWAFYRAGISRPNASTLRVGWTCVSYGCRWTYEEDAALVGIGVGGDSGEGGSWPYSNESLNLGATPVIVANGARYD